jgi:hypothetical protein
MKVYLNLSVMVSAVLPWMVGGEAALAKSPEKEVERTRREDETGGRDGRTRREG